ncbi:MAG: DUF6973 domain-containing protein [bacterium]
MFDPNGPGRWQAASIHPLDALLASNLADDARLMTQIKFGLGNPMYNNGADAFRHAYWSFTITRSIGAAEAKVFGDAHEISGPSPLGEPLMDLNNNQIGRDLATNTAGPTTPYAAVSDALDSGCLRTGPF